MTAVGALLSLFVAGGMWAVEITGHADVAACESARPGVEERARDRGLVVRESLCRPVVERGA